MKFLNILKTPLFFILNFIKTLLLTPLYLFKYLGIGLGILIINIYKLLKILLKNLINGLTITMKFLFKYIKIVFIKLMGIIKKIFIYLFMGLAALFKGIIYIIKKIFTYLFIGSKYLFLAIKKIINFILYLLKLIVLGFAATIKKIYNIITIVAIRVFRFFEFLYKTIIAKYLVVGFVVLFKGIYIIFKFIFLNLFLGLKYIFYVWPAAFYGLFSKYIDVAIKWVRDKFKEFGLYLKNIPKKITVYFKNKYNNIAIVKYLRNKKDMSRKILLIDFEDDSAKRTNKKLTYKYLARNSDGKVVRGYFDAFSKIDVHSFLLSEGFEVYQIKTSRLIQALSSSSSIKRYKIKQKDIAFMLTQLSTYIKSGVTLVDSIKILARQSKEAKRRKVFDNIIYELIMGESLSEALNKQGEAFPKLLINMIKTSEMTGKISEVLDSMAEYYDAMDKTRRQMITAMLYPSFVFVMSTVVVAFVLIFIVPEFIDMFNNMDTEIPTITQIVINASEFLQHNYIYITLGIIALVFLFRMAFKSIKFFRYTVQYTMMHVPVLGKIIMYNEVTMFSKTFGSLLIHNVFITDSMDILSKITNNEIYKMMIFDTVSNLARGDKISDAFKGQWAFPQVAYEMLVTGERTGQLGQMMGKVGDYYQEQHKNAVGQIKSFIEPVMITFLASMVGTILLAIVVPMFKMYEQF